MKDKKAQVTYFIIAGIIILLVLIVYWTTRYVQIEEENVVYQYEGQKELDLYVKGCLNPAVLQGLEIMRLQGGYIDIPADTKYLLVRDINGWTIREEGGIKTVAKGSGLNKVPYWVEREFREQGYIINIGEPSVDVNFGNSAVVDLNYPITFEKGDVKFTMDKFTFSVPVNMKLVIDRAADMAFYEDAYAYLEDNTNSLLSLFSGVDANKLPPITASRTNSDCSYVTWSKPSVKGSLKNILARNIPALKVKGTDYNPIKSANPEYQGVYDAMVWELFDGEYANLNVDFSYRPDWEISFDVKPSFGDSIQPDFVERNNIPFLPRFCVLRYKFKYFLGYPVLTEINDKNSAMIDPITNTFKEKAGYRFQFPMWAVLYGNQPREYVPRTEQPVVDLNALSSKYNATLLPETLFCKAEQRISDKVTVIGYDAETNKEIKDVSVYYRCGPELNTCFMGTTDDKGKLAGKFPLCINGFIKLRKTGYGELGETLTIFEPGEKTLPYFLEKIKELTFNVKAVNAKGLLQD